METMSDNIGELALALATAQGQFKPIERKSTNPFFHSKYADLTAINDGVREALVSNGLAVCQVIVPDALRAEVETYLIHKSGQWIKSTILLTPKKQIKHEIGKWPNGEPKFETITEDANDPQSMGSAITYARRYGLSAILSVATEDEDDGNEASKPQKATPKPEAKPDPPKADAPPGKTKATTITPEAKSEQRSPGNNPEIDWGYCMKFATTLGIKGGTGMAKALGVAKCPDWTETQEVALDKMLEFAHLSGQHQEWKTPKDVPVGGAK